MRRFITTLLCIATLAVGLRAANPEEEIKVAGIAFYNLENLFDTINANGKYDLEFSPKGSRKWDSEKYHAKINKLAFTIAQFRSSRTPLGAAIVGIAEVENESVVADLVNTEPLAAYGLKYVHHDSPDLRGIDVALLYNPELFEVTNVTNTPLIIRDEPKFRTRDQMCVTGLLMGKPVAVIVNHWPSRLGGREASSPRREAAAALSRHIADSLWKVNPDMGIIVMGDLNDDPHDKSCAMALGATRKLDKVRPHGFFNPFWDILASGKGTLAYKGDWNLFDQIIISGNLARGGKNGFNFMRAVVHDFDYLKNQDGPYKGQPHRTYASGKWLDGYSDHFPTEVFLTLDVEETKD